MNSIRTQNLMNLEEAANYLRMSPRYLANITRSALRLIPCVQAGRAGKKYFLKSDLDNYINSNLKPATA